LGVTSKGSQTRIKWEGDSNEEIRSWPDDVRSDLGLELHRLDNHEEPLDSKPMGDSLHELRDEHLGVWYRILYVLYAGWIYVLHCFKKTTNQTDKSDLDIAKTRFSDVKRRHQAAKAAREKKRA
jgi:phage-related protein